MVSLHSFPSALLILMVGAGAAWGQTPVPVMDLPIRPVQLEGSKKTPLKGSGEEGENLDPRDLPPPMFYGEEIKAEGDTIVYVIDRSCSMRHKVDTFEDEKGAIVKGGNRLDRVKAELKSSIEGLSTNLRFNVVFFGSCIYPLWPQLKAATEANKQVASTFVAGMTYGGWTNAGGAVVVALEDPEVRTVILLSDGSPNVVDCMGMLKRSPKSHRQMILDANAQGARIDTFGIALSHSSKARPFMTGVASDNKGTFYEIK